MARPPRACRAPAERGRAVLELVEEEFRMYGATIALRRVARVSCYYAKFLPGFDAFKAGVHAVKNIADFRRLVREHFR
ncbi:MAG: hypothetical protein QM775_34885 [Pirellulales bacterium]